MNRNIFGILILALLWSIGPIYASTVIFLPDQAQVKGLNFTLGEIAEIRQGNSTLGRLSVGDTPAPGKICYYSRQQLAERLREHGVSDQLDWRGAQEVAVQTQSIVVATPELVALAKEFLKLSLSSVTGDSRCELISAHRDRILLPAPRTSLQFLPRNGTKSSPGRTAVEIAIFIDNHRYCRIEFRFQVRLWQTVFVTGSFIRRHTLLTADKLGQRRLDITSLRQTPITSLDSLRGKRNKYNLPANRILCAEDIESAPDIARGASVVVFIHSANLTIRLRATALEDGYRGRIIRVARIPGNQILKAKVRDQNSVEFSAD